MQHQTYFQEYKGISTEQIIVHCRLVQSDLNSSTTSFSYSVCRKPLTDDLPLLYPGTK